MGIVVQFQEEVEARSKKIEPLSDQQEFDLLQLAQFFNENAEITNHNEKDFYIVHAIIRYGIGAQNHIFTVDKRKSELGPYEYLVYSPKTKTHQFKTYNFSEVLKYLEDEMVLASSHGHNHPVEPVVTQRQEVLRLFQ